MLRESGASGNRWRSSKSAMRGLLDHPPSRMMICPLLHRVRRIEAIDQRGAVEEFLVQHSVFGGAPQFFQMAATNHRIFFFERLLVLDGLCLHIIDLRLAALAGGGVGHGRIGAGVPDVGEGFWQNSW